MTRGEIADIERRAARDWRAKADRLERDENRGDERLRLFLTGRTTDMQIDELRRAADILDPAA